MMKTFLSTLLSVAGLGLVLAQPAQAHFQLVYTPEVNVEKAGDLPFKLIFWHPLENGPVMEMGAPQAFFVAHRGARTDLLPRLKPISFQGAENAAHGYEFSLPVKSAGDYILALTPAPYLEAGEDKYIQQITKSFVNKGGLPTGWNEPLGLATEIVPLVKPTLALAGSTFTAQVLGDGKPAADVEVEVEYMAAEPDMTANKPRQPRVSPPSGGAIVVRTDANGMFTFGLPKAGFWGFAALGSGPVKTYQGKELEQSAVIWVHAQDLK